jgi:hypothetical protein
MSALGQKQTSDWWLLMSALPPKADMAGRQFHVCFVPDSDMALAQKMIGIAWPRAMFEAAVFDRL